MSSSVELSRIDGVADGSAGGITSPLAPWGAPGAMVSVVPSWWWTVWSTSARSSRAGQ